MCCHLIAKKRWENSCGCSASVAEGELQRLGADVGVDDNGPTEWWLYLAHADHSHQKAGMELEEMASDDVGNGISLTVRAGTVDSGIEAVVVSGTTEWGREIGKAAFGGVVAEERDGEIMKASPLRDGRMGSDGRGDCGSGGKAVASLLLCAQLYKRLAITVRNWMRWGAGNNFDLLCFGNSLGVCRELAEGIRSKGVHQKKIETRQKIVGGSRKAY
ncbi:hypothetical protein B296_00022051 [Ensete ventricosum]|uniref:Uncharacterized protein n=1 Tax=Ensete ventricosum TaxID=4639 RepID=A0A426Z238_ENSVE|nr:hypothetical protein B296_00022051 [Ensete ventricosum]